MHRPRIKFTLRVLLAAVTLIAALLSVWLSTVEPYRQQSLAIDRYQDFLSGKIGRAFPVYRVLLVPGGPISGEETGEGLKRYLIEKLLGKRKCVRITRVTFLSHVSTTDLQFIITRMKFLRWVKIQRTDISHETLEALVAMKQLNHLEIIQGSLSDSDVEIICRSNSIATLELNGNQLTDTCLGYLARMDSLKELKLSCTNITESGILEFRAARPDVRVNEWIKIQR